MSRIDAFLELGVKQGGSDIHLVSGQPPRIRIHGAVEPVRFRELSVEDVNRMLGELLTDALRAELEERRSVDFAYPVEGIGRFRVNVFHHTRGLGAVFRVIPEEVTPLEELGLPDSVTALATRGKGLTLVTGPTGSGKSTTLAAIVDRINRTRRGHIITIEDPIEFVHPFKKCVVTQREIGSHAPSFAEALRNAVREDPDVILVGEVRDLETISLALTAAETGIQVLATLHTSGAVRTIDRIINVFPARRQDQVRAMLAESLRLIVSQQLVRTADGQGRILAAEVMVNTPAIASMIRSGKAHQLASAIQTGGSAGMQSLDSQLRRLVEGGAISGEEAWRHALDKAPFDTYAARREVA